MKSILKRERKNRLLSGAITCALAGSVLLSACGNKGGEAISESNTSEEEYVMVSSVEELIDAVRPGANIVIKKGSYDITPDLEDLYGGNIKKFNKSHDYVRIDNVGDGIQLVIQDVNGISISGQDGKKVEFMVEPRYADVISFEDCSDIAISNMTIGHTVEQGSCEGDVLQFTDCENITLTDLDLYGCGTYGITGYDTTGLVAENTRIHDCSYGIMYLSDCEDISFKKCDMVDNQGFTMLDIYDTEITFSKCTFDGNQCDNQYFSPFVTREASNTISFKACSFGEDESRAVSSGQLDGNSGVVFDGKCTFASYDEANGGNSSYDDDYYEVDNVRDLLERIGSDREILLKTGYYNISDFIADEDMNSWNNNHEYVKIVEVFDGLAIKIVNVDNLSITGGADNSELTEIVVEPRYAEVLSFEDCGYITLSSLKLGHTPGVEECGGDVVMLTNVTSASLYNMDLYGCGMIGLSAYGTGNVGVFDSYIHDCSWLAVEMYDIQGDVAFYNTKIENTCGMHFEPSRHQLIFSQCTLGEKEGNDVFYNLPFATVEDCEYMVKPEREYELFGYAQDNGLEYVSAESFFETHEGDTFWECFEFNDGGDDHLYPDYELMDKGEGGFMALSLLDDGTGELKGYRSHDILKFSWSYNDYADGIVITDIVCIDDGDDFGDAFISFMGAGYEPEFCMLEFDGCEIYFRLAF